MFEYLLGDASISVNIILVKGRANLIYGLVEASELCNNGRCTSTG
jgi:hypothetical protein